MIFAVQSLKGSGEISGFKVSIAYVISQSMDGNQPSIELMSYMMILPTQFTTKLIEDTHEHELWEGFFGVVLLLSWKR